MTSNRLPLLALATALLASLACGGGSADAQPGDKAAAGADPNAAAAAPAGSSPAATQPGAAAGQSPAPGGVVARVNGTPITAIDLSRGIQQFLESQGAPGDLPEAQRTQVRALVLDALIGSELLYQKSSTLGITVSEQEVEAGLAAAKQNFPDEAAFLKGLTEQGLDLAQVKTMLARSLAVDKVIQQEVLGKVAVSDEDVKKYYTDNPDQMRKEEEVRASHILFRIPEGSAEEAKKPIRDKAAATLVKAKAGEDFAVLATANSEDTGSAQKGGDLGFFRKGMMVAPFESAAFALTVGQISDLVESPFGYHIIKVTDRHEARTAPLEEVAGPLKNFLEQKQAREKMDGYIKGLKSGATIEIL